MVGRRGWAAKPWKLIQKPLALGLALQLLWGSWGESAIAATPATSGKLTETAAPSAFTKLGRVLDQYQPQIKILSPKAGEVLTDNSVRLSFEIQDLPTYKDKTLQLGPHLHLQIDDRPHQSIYDPSESVLLPDLEPGTHTLRLFAARPWDESFKNDGAFAQVTFHVFTKTDDNQPKPNQPLLTYNQPQGTYGAEPILLDFYLTNAPLHLIAQENDSDSIPDWKIKATVNGQSFLLDRWQPIYLQGFKPGKNWVQLEFIDQNGNRVENFGNNTARIFNYEPNGQDPIAQLTRGELTIAQSKGIVDPTYNPPAPPKPPAPKPETKPEAKSEVLPETKPEAKPVKPEAKPSETRIVPIVPIPLPQKAPELKTPKSVEPIAPKTEVKPEKVAEPKAQTQKIIQKILPAFMGPGKKIDVKTPIVPPAPIAKPAVKPAVLTPPTQTKSPSTQPIEVKPAAETKSVEAKPVEKASDQPKTANWLDRFRKPEDTKSRNEAKPTEIKPSEKTEPKPVENNAKKKPAIETRRSPINFSFGSDKKADIKTPVIPDTKTTQLKSPNTKPSAKKADSEPTEIKPIVNPTETKTIQAKQPDKASLKKDTQKVPATIPSPSESPKPLQLTPGKKVEIKTPAKPEIKTQVKPEEKLTPTPIKSIPVNPTKSTPQNLTKPISKPIVPSIENQTKPTNKLEEQPRTEKPQSDQPQPDKYEYLKEYLNKPNPTTLRPAS